MNLANIGNNPLASLLTSGAEVKRQIEQWRGELEIKAAELGSLVKWIEAFRVNNQADLDVATFNLKSYKGQLEQFEEARMAVTRPILAVKAQIDSLFKMVTGPLSQCEGLLKTKIAAYMSAQEAIRVSAMQASGCPSGSLIMPPPTAAGITIRKRWEVRIIDAAAVPRQYCIPDLKLLKGSIPSEGPPPAIPGVLFELVDSVAARVR